MNIDEGWTQNMWLC